MVFATSTVLSIPNGRSASSPRSPAAADSRGRPSHHQHVGERAVRLEQVLDIAGLLGELEHPRETLEALP